MKFQNDPFEIIFGVFTTLYPGLDCTVEWCTGMKDEDGNTVCGATVFPNDGGKPIVSVSGEIDVKNASEVLAHELAHVDSIKSLIKSYKKRCASYRKCGCKIRE